MQTFFVNVIRRAGTAMAEETQQMPIYATDRDAARKEPLVLTTIKFRGATAVVLVDGTEERGNF
jgi:hypothetical protein